MPHTRPLPIDMKVRDLPNGGRLIIGCPTCSARIGRQCYDLMHELPADMLVIRYVARHWCRRCSRNGGARVRAHGWIEPSPRSGAEGGNVTQWAR